MWKAILTILTTLLLMTTAYAQEMQVKEVRDINGIKEAVIEDQQTGDVWTVREGDTVREWKVVEITDTLVTIEQETGPPWVALRAQMPVNRIKTPAIQTSP